MKGGYTGKTLVVDLSNNKFEIIDFSDQDKRNFLGGYGLGAKYIYENQKAGTEPLSENSILGILAGPITGTNLPAVSRYTVCGKSPLTNTWGDANGSGSFGPYMKFSGFDGVFVTGKAEKPKYILLDNGNVEIKDAGDLWGMDTYETEDALYKKYDKNTHAACIGPAGEKVSLISGVVTNKGRIAARSGLGAVMGYKRLKAVVVRGNEKVPIADEERYKNIRKKFLKQIADGYGSAELLREMGTPGIAYGSLLSGDMPIKNWYGSLNDMKDIGHFEFDYMEQYKINKKGCYACPIACWGHAMVKKGDFALKEPAHMPEYEAIGCLGGYCLNSDFEVIIKINDICNRSGLDVISAGTAISFAMDCYDRGILSKKELDDIDLTWGNGKAMVELAEKIARNEGIGELLAKGVKVASEEIGRGSEDLAIHIQGQELPAHDGKLFTNMALSYGIDPTPARHTQWSFAGKPQKFDEAFPDIRADFDQEVYTGRAKAQRKFAALGHCINSMGSCLFGYNSTDVFTHPECYAAITGWGTDVYEFAKTGERIGNMRQIFTVREGSNPINFNYPKALQGDPPLKDGPLKKVKIDIDKMKKEFYEEMDWDLETGMPSEKKMKELGLDKLSR